MNNLTQPFIKTFRSVPSLSSSTFLLAVSGGADSMVLLHLFLDTQKLFKTSLLVLHMNHHLREQDSDADEDLVHSFCKKNAVPYECVHFHPSDWESIKGTGLEEKARKLRKKSLQTIRSTHHIDVSVIGHNLDDLCETFLFNLIRGSSPEKLSGVMPLWDPMYKIFRPLLPFSRKTIRDYAHANQIPYRNDASNSDIQFSRNRIRKNILTEMQQINPNFASSILRFQAILSSENDWMEGELLPIIESMVREETQILVSLPLFISLHKALQRRLILHIRKALIGHRDDFSFAAVESIRSGILLHPQKNGILYSDPNMTVENKIPRILFVSTGVK